MKKLILPLIAAVLVSAAASAQAQTENVDFSITGLNLLAFSYKPDNNSNLAVTGTLTGELFGLNVGSSDTTPTSIEITNLPYPSSAPALTLSTPLTFVPVTASDDSSPDTTGSFSVNANGTINATASHYSALYQSTTNPSEDLILQFDQGGEYDGFILTYNNQSVDGGYDNETDTIESQAGASGITYTVATPEPSSWMLGLCVCGVLVALRAARA